MIAAPPPPGAPDNSGEPQATQGIDAVTLTIGLSLCFLVLCAVLLLASC